jgi:hypothetical protein
MMETCKQLFIFVEGYSDELFFDKVVELVFREKYDWVSVIQWAQERPSKTDSYIRSIKSENWGAEYILVTDMDTPCVTARKEEIQKRFRNVDEDRIMVVAKEIESWYLAVLDDGKWVELGIPPFGTTDDVTKEQFGELVPEMFDSEVDFIQEILMYFDIETAKQKNKSFRYFAEKYDP